MRGTQDLRYALRTLAKSRGFALVAILTLALGIGANTAVFSVFNGVLLRPLPFPDPDRLLMIYERSAEFEKMSVSYLNFLDWQRQNRTFARIAAWRGDAFNFTGAGDPERLTVRMVTADFFSMLGVKPVMGRTFRAEEDGPGGNPVVLLSEGFWKRRFGGDRGILGAALTLNGKRHTVIGIIPEYFRLEGRRDVFVPLGQWDDPAMRLRDFHPGLRVTGRLRPGVTVAQARADMEAIARGLAEQYPKVNGKHSVTIESVKETIVGDVRPTLWVLLGAVAFVLLIACANVANLLLARATVRQREMAVRAALGAGRRRLIRQLLTESLVLAVLGGLAGLALSAWCTDLVLRAVPSSLPRVEEVGVDWRVLAFTLLVSLLTGVIFGLVPALQVAAVDLHDQLKETAGRGATGGRRRSRDVLVVSELALALVLLTGAGLMIRSLWRLRDVDPGFEPHNVLTLEVALSPANSRSAATVRIAFPQLLDRVKSIPGIEAAATTADLPLDNDSEAPFFVRGRQHPTSMGDMLWAMFYPVSPDYLRAMKIPLVRGRFFTEHDNENSPTVAVIDEEMARGVFPNEDPLGKTLVIPAGSMELPLQIVGLAGHVKHWGLDADAQAKVRYQLYLPFRQIPDAFMVSAANGMTLVLRTAVNPLSVVSAVKAQIMGAGRDQPVYNVRTMEAIVTGTLAQRRFSMLLLGIFAGLALLLASVGIYGVISYSVSQRVREIGIRMALGAARPEVLRLVVGQGMPLVLLGVVIGVGAALLATRAMSSLLFGVSATDPATLTGVSLVLGATALLAAYLPARRAAKVDPAAALRHE